MAKSTLPRDCEALFVHPVDLARHIEGGDISFSFDIIDFYRRHGVRVALLGVGRNRHSIEANDFRAVYSRRNYRWYGFLLGTVLTLRRLKIPTHTVIQTAQPLFSFPFLLFRLENPKLIRVGAYPLEYVRLSFPFLLPLIRPLYRLAERILVERAERLVFVSKDLLDIYATKYPHLVEKFEVVSAGIDLDVFRRVNTSRRPPDIPESAPVILFAGRIERVKNLDFLLEAFTIVKEEGPNTHFLIVGRGNDEDRIREVINERRIPDVHLLGEVDHREMPMIYSLVDVLVLASISEGSPAVVREAIACGTPVVATDVGDTASVLTEGTGIIASNDPRQFARAIKEVLSWDRSFVVRKCGKARQRFSFESVGMKYVRLLRQLRNDQA